MRSYVCPLCGHVHVEEIGDLENGISPGTPWEDVPDEYLCPSCDAPKFAFVELDG
jgi:rubredoxin